MALPVLTHAISNTGGLNEFGDFGGGSHRSTRNYPEAFSADA